VGIIHRCDWKVGEDAALTVKAGFYLTVGIPTVKVESYHKYAMVPPEIAVFLKFKCEIGGKKISVPSRFDPRLVIICWLLAAELAEDWFQG